MSFNKEINRLVDLSEEMVSHYASTFIHRRDCYPIQIDRGSYVTIKQPLGAHMLKAHLKGLITLGAYALNEQSKAHWLCFDADTQEPWEEFKKAYQRLALQGITTYLEVSRRGGHWWLFTPPLAGQHIRQFAQSLLRYVGIAEYDPNKKQRIEIYPKQDHLQTGTGSLVRLPLGIHRKTGKRYPFIFPHGEHLAPTVREQMALLSNPSYLPLSFIEKILSIPEPTPLPSTPPPLLKRGEAFGNTLSERIKASISVLDFVSRYMVLDERQKGLCPFHDDQEQSFQVHPEKNFWHCYAGCKGQTVIDFWMKWREKQGQDASFTATITDLARMLF